VIDVEISEDMFIITSEEAEKHIKPPELVKILISPSQVQVKPGLKQTFTAKGLDQFNRDIEIDKIDWSATGGKIGTDGVYKSGNDQGNFLVSAKVGKIEGSASIEIRDEELPPPPPPKEKRKLIWSGEVTPQKWMNLYTKVLTKFVKDGEIKLNVSMEASPINGVTDQHIEDTKAALRELGLDDDIQVR